MSFSAPCEHCQEMEEECVPHSRVQGALACQHCTRRKAQCSHVGPSAGAAASTNVVEWCVAVHEGVALVADAMDCQTEVLGELANEVSGLRQAVECLSSSSTSSLQGAMSGGDTGQESVWGGDEDGEEMWVDGEMVKLRMHGDDEESGGAEEDKDEGGKHDEEDEEEGDDEEGDEEGDVDEGGGNNEEEDREEKGADDEGGTEPEASTTP